MFIEHACIHCADAESERTVCLHAVRSSGRLRREGGGGEATVELQVVPGCSRLSSLSSREPGGEGGCARGWHAGDDNTHYFRVGRIRFLRLEVNNFNSSFYYIMSLSDVFQLLNPVDGPPIKVEYRFKNNRSRAPLLVGNSSPDRASNSFLFK